MPPKAGKGRVHKKRATGTASALSSEYVLDENTEEADPKPGPLSQLDDTKKQAPTEVSAKASAVPADAEMDAIENDGLAPKQSAKRKRGKKLSTEPSPNDSTLVGESVKANEGKSGPASSASRPGPSLDAIKLAIKTNPNGVRIVETNLENSKKVMAGYLHLKDTQSFDDFLGKSDNEGIMEPWRLSRLNGFSIVGLDGKAVWGAKQLFETIGNLTGVQKALLQTQKMPITAKELKLNEKSPVTGYICWIAAMSRLIIKNPSTFTNADAVKIGGHSAEDWHRAYCTLRYYYRSKSAARINQNMSARTRNTNHPATEPHFLTEEHLGGRIATAGPDGGSHALNRVAMNMVIAEDSDDEELASNDSQEAAARVDAKINESLKNFVQKDGDVTAWLNSPTPVGSSGKDIQQRPPLTREELMAFCEAEGKRVIVKHNAGVDADANVSNIMANAVDLGAARRLAEELGDEIISDEKFHELQSQLNDVSATGPGYKASADICFVDPATRQMPGGQAAYQSWQVEAIAWMVKQEDGEIGGGILGSGCGTGKTVSGMGLIEVQAERKKREYEARWEGIDEEKRDPPDYRATIILCPCSLIETWFADHQKFFNGRLQIKQWYGSMNTVSQSRREHLISGGVEGLNKFLGELDCNDVMTAKTIILSAYSTAVSRGLSFQEVSNKGKGRQSEPEEEDAADEQENKALYEEVDAARIITCSIETHNVERIILDEGHIVKNPRTLAHRMVSMMSIDHVWILSATACWNGVADLGGPLRLFFKPSWQLKPGYNYWEIYDDDFDPFNVPLEDSDDHIDVMPSDDNGGPAFWFREAVQAGKKLYILNPEDFKKLNAASDVSSAYQALPAIFKLLMLRHTMNTKIDLEDGTEPQRIGSNIPPFTVHTIELEMTTQHASAYNSAYAKWTMRLNEGGSGETLQVPPHLSNGSEGGVMNLTAHNRLVGLSLNQKLETFNSRMGASVKVKQVQAIQDKNRDHGVTMFFQKTKPAPYLTPYTDRMSMARYISSEAPKLQWLACQMGIWCLRDKERIIIWFERPQTQWNVEKYLATLGFNVLSVRSCHTMMERAAIFKKFNNPTEKVDALCIGLRLGGLGVNVQFACRRAVLMDCSGNGNEILQGPIGRLHRMGQQRKQEIYLLTTDHTYDQRQQARLARKMVPLVAGQAKFGPDSNQTIDEQSEDLVRRMFGQRSSRLGWGDKDLKLKDSDVKEKLALCIVLEPERYRKPMKKREKAEAEKRLSRPREPANPTSQYMHLSGRSQEIQPQSAVANSSSAAPSGPEIVKKPDNGDDNEHMLTEANTVETLDGPPQTASSSAPDRGTDPGEDVPPLKANDNSSLTSSWSIYAERYQGSQFITYSDEEGAGDDNVEMSDKKRSSPKDDLNHESTPATKSTMPSGEDEDEGGEEAEVTRPKKKQRLSLVTTKTTSSQKSPKEKTPAKRQGGSAKATKSSTKRRKDDEDEYVDSPSKKGKGGGKRSARGTSKTTK